METLDRIKSLMKENSNMSRAKLAEASGVSLSTLNSMFSRNSRPTDSTLTAICKAFGISVTQFYLEMHIPVELPEEDVKLLDASRRFTRKQRDKLISFLDSLSE